MNYNEVIKYADEFDKTFTADRFISKVRIVHQDGSEFSITRGLVYKYSEWLVCYYEHGRPLIFHSEDLKEVVEK